MTQGLSFQQVEQFQDDGFLIVRDLLPRDAVDPLIGDIERKVDDWIVEAVARGILHPRDTFVEASFETRLALASNRSSEPSWMWEQIQSKRNKTAGMFTLRTWPTLLDVAESLLGPEILAHPQTVLRAKLPDQEETVVPWHQDLAYLIPEKAGDTLVVNFWIPLVDATTENGCLQVIRGSHQAGLLPHEEKITIYVGVSDADLPSGEIVTCDVNVGDAVLTMERLLHRSIPNMTDTIRWSVDSRYSQVGLPTGRPHAPGFVARSKAKPDSVARSHHDWIHLFTEAGLDWQERRRSRWSEDLFELIEQINTRPLPFSFCTVREMWTDEHVSKQMLDLHRDSEVGSSPRNQSFIDRAQDWIVSHFGIAKGTKVADFGCGPGLYAMRLAKVGAYVTGIDFSERSIQYATKIATAEGLSISYVNENYLEYEAVDRFHLIVLIGHDLCALSPAKRKQLLGKFQSMLLPEGSILLDVYSLNRFSKRTENQQFTTHSDGGFWARVKYYEFEKTFKYDDEKVALEQYTVIESGRNRTFYNWFQHFSPEDLASELAECGLKVEETYADVAGRSFDPEADDFTVVAKPA